MNDRQSPNFDRAIRAGVLVGLLALLTSSTLFLRNPVQFYRSYLLAYVFWIGFPLGSMAILMLHHLTGGEWGLPIRRPLEAATRTFPLMLILFLPLIFGLKTLFPWAHPGGLGSDPIMKFKRMYLNPNFFMARVVIYFLVWFTLSYFLNKWSAEQDETGDPVLAKRLEGMSGPGLILYGLTTTYAAMDWIMSLQPNWYSTIFGMIYMMVGVLGAMSVAILVARMLSNYEPMAAVVTPDQFNDLGNLLLAFVMLWAYLSFSQFLIIWSGNLPKEISWYVVRAEGGWARLAVFLIIFHFAIPFLLLLQRGVKRQMKALAIVAGALIFISFVDVFWLVVPAFEPGGPRLHPFDLTLPIAIGGLWVASYAWQLKRRPVLPLHDPRFEGVAAHGD
ncbi:MAG: hypothetical protein WAK91_12160 [Candidatus Acidiferrales bacterium]|jgi:hypothetical protein